VTLNKSFYNELSNELITLGNAIVDYDLVGIISKPITSREYNY